MSTAQFLFFVGAGASIATQTWLPFLVAIGIAVVTGGTSRQPRGARLILRQRPNDWLLEQWIRESNVTNTYQLTPTQGQALFARFKDSVIATIATAPIPRKHPGSPQAGDLASLRLLYQEEVPFGTAGFTLFLYDPARDALIRRALDQMTGELLLARFNADIVTYGLQ